jgi:predicted N-acyltransferase
MRGSDPATQVLVSTDHRPAAIMFMFCLSAPGFALNDPVQLLFDTNYRESDSAYQTREERSRYVDLQASLDHDAYYPAAVCVAPVGLTAGIATKGRRAGVADALLDAFGSIADGWHAKTRALLYLDSSAEAILQAGRYRPEFVQTAMDVRTVLPVESGGLPTYLGRLKHHRRQAVRAEIKALRAEGLRVAILGSREIRPIAEELAVLAAKVQAKHGNPFDPDTAHRTFSFLLQHFPDLLRAIVAVSDEEVVAFHLVYIHRNTLYSAFSGQDYSERARRGFAHFNVLFYEALRVASDHRLRRIDYGVGVGNEHLHRGCSAVPLIGLFQMPPGTTEATAEMLFLLDRAQRCRAERAAGHRAYRLR